MPEFAPLFALELGLTCLSAKSSLWLWISDINATDLLCIMNKRRLYTWTSPDGQHPNQISEWYQWLYSLQPKMEKLYTVSKNKTGSWLWLRSWTPYAKFTLKLNKVGKTTTPFRYDLNQIPSDYTVEVRNRFTGLDLIECLMNYG